jgi:hypothetical protein
MKKVIWIFIVIVVLVGVFYISKNTDKKIVKSDYCFAFSENDDFYNLNLSIRGETARGYFEFKNEEESKYGVFDGIISPDIEELPLRALAAWWDIGDVTEQLTMFVDKDFISINIGVGEMVPDEMGRLIYLDTRNTSYDLTLLKVDC